MDFLFVFLTVFFFLLTAGLVALCDRLKGA
jgi:hypothetical protein